MSAGSTRLFIFSVMRPASPSSAWLVDAVGDGAAQVCGRDQQLPVLALVAVAGEVVEQVGEVGAELGVGGEQPEVLVEGGGLRVVVAGADVAVAPDPVGLLAHDEQHLGVGLQPDEAVHDVHARLLPATRARSMLACSSKRAFSSTSATTCLPDLGRLHQRADQRALGAGGAVDGLLDREHVRVGRPPARRTARPTSRTSRTGGARARRRCAAAGRSRAPGRRPAARRGLRAPTGSSLRSGRSSA